MHTEICQINPENFGDEELTEAGRILKKGGLVAFPTETVYGLGANALREEAAEKIYQAKGRPSDNPLIIHIGERKGLYQVARNISDKAEKLADAFWPGPLTMIFDKQDVVPMKTTGGLSTVAVRMPSHPVAQALIRHSGIFVAAPSANTSGRPSPTTAQHVIEDLKGKIQMIIDGGTVGIGLESTIVDMTGNSPVILRPGFITKEMLEGEIGPVQIDPALLSRKRKKGVVAKAPGMKYRHYAPKGQMTIVKGNAEAVVTAINDMAAEKKAMGCRVAVIATEETKHRYCCDLVRSIGSRRTEGSIAAGLYDILREMDHIGAEFIFAESFEEDRLGKAIMNRMLKAAAYHLIQV